MNAVDRWAATNCAQKTPEAVAEEQRRQEIRISGSFNFVRNILSGAPGTSILDEPSK